MSSLSTLNQTVVPTSNVAALNSVVGDLQLTNFKATVGQPFREELLLQGKLTENTVVKVQSPIFGEINVTPSLADVKITPQPGDKTLVTIQSKGPVPATFMGITTVYTYPVSIVDNGKVQATFVLEVKPPQVKLPMGAASAMTPEALRGLHAQLAV